MLKTLFLPPLLSFWKKGKKIHCLSTQLSRGTARQLSVGSSQSHYQCVSFYNSWHILQKKHSLSDHLLGHHHQASRMAPRTQQQKPVSTLPKCAASTFVWMNLSSSFLKPWIKKQSLCRHGGKPPAPSTCARAQSTLYLFKLANKGCYCDSWTKGAIKISKTLAAFPASWVASLSPPYLGILPVPSWLCPLQRQGRAAWQPRVGVQYFLPSWSH